MEERKPIELSKILQEPSIILLDGSLNFGHESNPLRYLHGIKSYASLDPEKIKPGILTAQGLQKILEHPRVYTTHGVSEEMATHYQRIKKKRNYLEKKGTLARRILEKERHAQEIRKKSKRALLDFQRAVESLAKTSKNNLYGFDYHTFTALHKMTTSISRALHLKKDTNFELGYHDEDKSEDSNVDEGIAAAAIYISTVSNQSVTVLTADTDICRLLRRVPSWIGARSFQQNGLMRLFRQRFKTNFPRVCLETRGVLRDHAVNPERLFYRRSFDSTRLKRDESRELQEKISQLWQEIEANTPTTPLTLHHPK